MPATKVYLAGHHMADEYRANASEFLRKRGYAVIDPMRDEHDYRGIEGDNVEKIVRGDLADVVESDIVLSNFSQNSVGTSMETWFAASIRRPVISFVESDEYRISPWAHYVSLGRRAHVGLDTALASVTGHGSLPGVS